MLHSKPTYNQVAMAIRILLLLVTATCQDTPTRQDARELVRNLSSESKADLEATICALRKLRGHAAPALREALKGKNPTVVSRARALLDEFTPEGTLKAIEDTLITAPGAHIFIASKSGAGNSAKAHSQEYSGTLVLGTSNRNFGKLVAGKGSSRVVLLLVSDGKRTYALKQRGGDGAGLSDVQRELTRPNQRKQLAVSFVRGGLLSALSWNINGLRFPTRPARVSWMIKNLSNDASSSDDSSLSFRLYLKPKKFLKVILWYDPETYQLKKRETSSPDGSSLVTETYSKYKLKADFPDKQFTLPD